MATDRDLDNIPLPTGPIPPVVMSQELADISKIYKSPFPSCILIFPNGKPAHFRNNRFVTNVASEIEFLDAEIARGNQGLYIDKDEHIVTAAVDVLSGLKEQWEKEFLAKQAAAISGDADMGKHTPDKHLNMGNSKGISGLAAGSASNAPVLGIKIK